MRGGAASRGRNEFGIPKPTGDMDSGGDRRCPLRLGQDDVSVQWGGLSSAVGRQAGPHPCWLHCVKIWVHATQVSCPHFVLHVFTRHVPQCVAHVPH